jgi:hypothetical protein
MKKVMHRVIKYPAQGGAGSVRQKLGFSICHLTHYTLWREEGGVGGIVNERMRIMERL